MSRRRLSIADFVVPRAHNNPLNEDGIGLDDGDIESKAPSIFAADVAAISTRELLEQGERYASTFLTQCGRVRHVPRRLRYSTSLGRGEEKAKNVFCKYDQATKVYTVHAVIEIQAGLKEVLHLLAGDIDPTSSRHGFNVFLWRVFGGALDSAVNLRFTKPYTNHQEKGDDIDELFLTMRKIKRSYEGAAVKQTTFCQSNFFRKSKAEWLMLDYIQRRSDSSIVRVFKSVDNTTSYTQQYRGKTIPRHMRILFGFHIEELSFFNGGVCRLTFHGTHEATKANHPSHKLLEKLGQSLQMIDLAVMRRRLGRKVQWNLPAAAVHGDVCIHCLKFSNGIVCRLCAAQVCIGCSSIEQVETALHSVFELRACDLCVRAAKEQTKTDTVMPMQLEKDPKGIIGLYKKGMYRISEATIEGSYQDRIGALHG